MQDRHTPEPADLSEPAGRLTLARILTGILGLVVFASAWFAIAGRITWWQGWAFLLTFIAFVSILVWRVSKVNPELVRERNAPAGRAEAWDRAVMRVYSAVLMLLLIVSALDSGRFAWSAVPVGVQIMGWILLVVAGAVVWHVMMINAYLSSWARIQDDRGQQVVQEGLYARIRHPMYLGIIVGFLGMPLALGSWWALVPAVLIAGLFVYRTVREDRMLMGGLAGYAEYAEKVRYRLLPRVW